MEKKTSGRLIKLINKFNKSKILIIGDIILDEYITGDVSRISPEAPVPIVEARDKWFSLGGSGNVADNLAELGCHVTIAGLIGNDFSGMNLKNMLKKRQISSTGLFVDNNRPTILKTRIIARNQQVVRVDTESKKKINDAPLKKIQEFIYKNQNSIDAIILSDYGKGVVIPEIIEQALLIKKKNKIPVIVDPKIEHFMNYKDITIMTPNKKEAAEGIKIPITDEKSLYKAGRQIQKDLNLEALLITRSEEGMSLFFGSKIFNIPTEATEVFDVTGAGDTVVSVLSLCLSLGADFTDAAILANIAAGEVVKEIGTTAIKKEKLIYLVNNHKREAVTEVIHE